MKLRTSGGTVTYGVSVSGRWPAVTQWSRTAQRLSKAGSRGIDNVACVMYTSSMHRLIRPHRTGGSAEVTARKAEFLAADRATVAFGGVQAIAEVDLRVEAAEILGLIGPNGAGKTTLLNLLSGFVRPDVGDVVVGGQVITGWAPNRRARAGIGRTFQAARLFADLTVAENIVCGGLGVGLSSRLAQDRAQDLLRQAGLGRRSAAAARTLTHGEARRVAILRALAGMPRFLLLDEPAAGLNEHETDELTLFLRQVRDELGCGLVVVEHDMRLVMSLCERLHVLDHGKTIFVGPPADARQDAAVLAAYLGAGHD